MTVQRSTTVKLMIEHCPKALDYYEEGVPYSRTIFAVGSVVHDLLWAIGEANGALAVLPATMEALATKGRAGVDAEPPYNVDVIHEGAVLARAYAPNQHWPKEERWYELGIAVEEDLTTLRPYDDETAYFRSRGDMAAILYEEHEDDVVRVLEVTDYKSAWPTGPAELETFQRAGQAITVRAWAKAKGIEYDTLRMSVVNLRTHGRFSIDLYEWDDGTWASMEERVHLGVKAAAHQPRLKSPGAGCIACPFLNHCGPELPAEQDLNGVGYAVLEARFKSATASLRASMKDSAEVVEVTGGTLGYHATTKQVPVKDAHERLWRALASGRADMGSAAAMFALGALQATITSATQVKKLAAHIHQDGRQKIVMAARRALIEECLEEVPASVFKTVKVKA